MLILPVIDLLDGQVVRGIAGQRCEYRPITSPLVPCSQPATVARAFRERFGLSQVYVADLDAIAGRPVNSAAWQAIAGEGMSLWLDAGVSSTEQAQAIDAEKIIVGLESLTSEDELARMVAQLGPERVVFSLDLKGGELLTSLAEFKSLTPLALAERVAAAGVRRMIVLNLADVGVNQGVGTLALCQQIHESRLDVQLIAGGGVRDRDDLHRLFTAGCSVALVASALHDGRLTAEDCRAVETWQ